MILTRTGKAPAKINLSLDITSKMDDGYHSLKTVMQTVTLCDEITIESKPQADNVPEEERVFAGTGLPYIPADCRNVAVRAAIEFFRHTGIDNYSAGIRIEKNIPVCAGLGGGSADAACVLRMLDEMFGTGLGRDTLEELGYAVGADVPFCIGGGTRLAEGRGEILTALPPVPKCHVVICKPPFACSTPEIFKRVSVKDIRARPDTDGMIKAIAGGDLEGIARRMYNVFEDILPHGKADVDSIKSVLFDCGALGAVMSGSGPSVFGLFDSIGCAKDAYGKLRASYDECFLAETEGGV